MAKLKNTDTVTEVEVSSAQETIQEIDISPNTSIDAQITTTADSGIDTVSGSSVELESEGATISEIGKADASKSQIISSQPSKKDKLPSQKGSNKSYQESPNNFIMEILKAHSNYETLYVDKLGCAYTPDTPEPIRGLAVLYNNPYFKSE